jgi:hypothetical protein
LTDKMAGITSKTPLKRFNETVKEFLVDLKGVFEPNDREILTIETAFDLTSVNARLFIRPFQTNLLSHANFVDHIMQEDVQYFIHFDFTTILSAEDDGCARLFNKFKQATVSNVENKQLLKAIFNWLKVMIYYAKLDQGVDVCAGNKTATDETVVVDAKCS